MASQPSPDERFDQVESTLEQLSNSFRHLLTAQVLINDAQQRAEKLIERLAGQGIETNQRIDKLVEWTEKLSERLDKLSENVDSLADGQKHNDSNIEALSEIVRQWIERNGNGSASH